MATCSCAPSGQDESNPALWLATRAGKMELSCPPRITRRVRQEKFLQKPYIKSLLTKFVRLRWLDIGLFFGHSFFVSLWPSTPSRSINTQKKKLANIQPSWPHTWSITNIYCSKIKKKVSSINQGLNLVTSPCSLFCWSSYFLTMNRSIWEGHMIKCLKQQNKC